MFFKISYLSSWVFTAMQSVHIRMNSSLNPPPKKFLNPPMERIQKNCHFKTVSNAFQSKTWKRCGNAVFTCSPPLRPWWELSVKLYLLWRVFVIHLLSFLSLRGALTLVSYPTVLSTYISASHCLKHFCESVQLSCFFTAHVVLAINNYS